MRPQGSKPLADRNWDRGAAPKLFQQFDVVSDNRLLEPCDVASLESHGEFLGPWQGQSTIGVDHEFDVRTYGVSHGLDSGHIVGQSAPHASPSTAAERLGPRSASGAFDDKPHVPFPLTICDKLVHDFECPLQLGHRHSQLIGLIERETEVLA
jgi:hypothetical protein